MTFIQGVQKLKELTLRVGGKGKLRSEEKGNIPFLCLFFQVWPIGIEGRGGDGNLIIAIGEGIPLNLPHYSLYLRYGVVVFVQRKMAGELRDAYYFNFSTSDNPISKCRSKGFRIDKDYLVFRNPI